MASPEYVSPEQMRDELLKQLYENRKDLKGIALVTGIKALRDLIPPAPPAPLDDGVAFSVLDQIASLPKSEGKKLLRLEIVRLRADLEAHEAAERELMR